MLGFTKKSVCIGIVILLMVSSLGMIVSSNAPVMISEDVEEGMSQVSQDIEAVELAEPVNEPPIDNSPVPKERVTVTIFTNNMGQLAIDLSGIDHEGSLGTNGDPDGLFVTLDVPSGSIEQISQMSSVLEVYVHPEISGASTSNFIEPPVNTEGIPPTDPASIYDVWQQGTVDAWIDDFIGTGVKVAVPYGIDFGTPDLQGRQARDTNASSPYYGWPIMFDLDSMDHYLSTNGDTDGTWYVNTSEVRSSSSLYFNTDIDNEFEWDNSISVLSGIPDPQPSGMLEMMMVSGLEPEAIYDFNIRVMDEAGHLSSFSTTPNATAFLDDISPAAITDLVASTGPDHESVILSFTATGDDGSIGTATEYYVKYSQTPIPNHVCFDHLSTEYTQAMPAPMSSGSMENILLTGLDMGIDYYFAIIAMDEAGNPSAISNDDNAIVKNDVIPPARIDPMASSGLNSTDVSLQWTASGDDGMTGVTASYELRYSTSPITTDIEFQAATIYPDSLNWIPQSAGSIENYSLNMPVAGTIYYLSIVAIDMAGNIGPISAPAGTAPSQTSDVVFPAQIVDLSVDTGLDHGTVYLNFTASGDDGMIGWASEYVVKFDTSPIDAGNWDTVPEIFGTSGTYIYTVDDPLEGGMLQSIILGVTDALSWSYLSPDQDMYFALRAVDEEGNAGQVSNCDHDLICEDIIGPSAITDLIAIESDNHGQVMLSWTAPGDNDDIGFVKQYVIKWDLSEVNDGNWGSISPTQAVSISTDEQFDLYLGGRHEAGTIEFINLTMPDQGTLYFFAIKAFDEMSAIDPPLVSNSQSSMARNDIIAPSPIDDLSAVTSNSHGEVILYWNSTGDDGDIGTADEYLVRYRESFPEYRYIDSSSYEGGPIVSYNIIGIDSASGNYRLGFHPGENLAYYMNGGYPSKVLLIDSQIPGVYDRVYVDLDHDMDFSDEKPCVKGDEISYRDMDDDGLADISGGMIYFISDGTIPIPYSDVYAGKHGVSNVIPQNGDLVAFFGEFDQDSVIGTAHAASIAGQGKMSHTDIPTLFPVVGQAPDATIIGITDTMYDGMTFAVEGYDGIPGTGDEANIISNGLSFPTIYEDGFDTYSKYLDWLTMNYSEGNTAIAATTGASGSGYGTVTSPGSAPGVITAGLATNLFYRIPENQDTGPNPSYGDIVSVSGRGPTMMGTPKPDIVASGAYFSFVSQPLYTAYDIGPNADYTNTVEIMGDHALAASTTAGGLALIYEAYEQTNGHYPISEEAKTLITSGADDLNYDALVQGAGHMNPGQSTKIASNTAGTKVSPTSWVPGDYNGERYEAFVNLIGPGTLAANLDQEFTIENTGSSAINADITAGEILKVGEGTIKLTRDDTNYHAWTILNQTGFWSPAGELLAPMNESLWTDTTLAKVTMFSDYSDYWLELFDWTDMDGDGILDGDLEDGPYGGHGAFAERNRMNSDFTNGNVLECRVHDLSDPSRVHDGIAIWSRSMAFPSGDVDLYLKVEYYSRQTWDWITFDETSLSIAGGATGTFTATLDLDKAIAAGVGSYEGDIVSTVDGRKTVIPVVINVAADSPNFEFGGDSSIDISETYTGSSGNIIIEGELALDGASSNQMSFNLNNGGITNQTYLEIDGIDVVISPYEHQSWILGDGKANDTLLENSPIGGFDTIMLSHQDIVPGSERFLIYTWGDWYWMGPSEANNTGWYNFDPITGAFQLLWDFDVGDYFYAWYDHYMDNGPLEPSWYSVNDLTGEVDLDPAYIPFGLTLGTDVYAWYTYESTFSSLHTGYSNIIAGSYTMYKNGVPFSEHHEVMDELVFVNSFDVNDELVLVAVGGEITASLDNGGGAEDIAAGTYIIYLDGIPVIDGIDYVLNSVTGEITFTIPLIAGTIVTADYSYYYPNLTEVWLDNGEVFPGFREVGNLMGYAIFINGFAQDTFDLEVNESTGEITLFAPLAYGDIIEAWYHYGSYEVDLITGYVTLLDTLGFETGDTLMFNYSYIGTNYLFDTNTLSAPSDYSATTKSGDWRYYYTTVTDPKLFGLDNTKFVIETEWLGQQTDINSFAFGQVTDNVNPASGDLFPSDRYGPYGMQNNGGSLETLGPFTSTGVPWEYATANITTGLNIIAVHMAWMDGSSNIEPFNGLVGKFALDKEEVNIVTNSLTGQVDLSCVSSIDLQGVDAETFGTEVTHYSDMVVWQDDPDWWNYPTFQEQLTSGNTTVPIVLNDCAMATIHVVGQADVVDLDLAIYYDYNGDGHTQADEFIVMDADFDADETVTIFSPVDGTYLIRVFGFNVITEPAHYDMEILISSPGISPFYITNMDHGFLPENTFRDFNLAWDFLGSTEDGYQYARLHNGPMGTGPIGSTRCFDIPINLLLDRVLPEIDSLSPAHDSIGIISTPTISANYSDALSGLDIANISITMDGLDVTSDAVIGVSGLTYDPAIPLDEGKHIIEVTVWDIAGNSNSTYWWFTVGVPIDTTAPLYFDEYPAPNGGSINLTPAMSVCVSDISGVNVSTIEFYINTFPVLYDLVAIAGGYNVSYWHLAGFAQDEVITCRIVAEDMMGNVLDHTWTFTVMPSAPMFTIELVEGWNLISLPLEQTDGSLDVVLSSIAGKWDKILSYNGTNIIHWTGNATFKPDQYNDLDSLDHRMGFWINITEADVNLTVSGIIPTSTSIPLYAGWNLVSYPSLDGSVNAAIAFFGTGADMIETFDPAATYNVCEVEATDLMQPGNGYWVHVMADTMWVVDW